MAGTTMKPLSGKQMKLLSALLTAPSIAAAAKLSGIPERTVYRLLKDHTFIRSYQEARGEMVRLAVVKIQQAALNAGIVLEQIMNDSLAKPSARVLACRTILHTALQAIEIEDIQSRLSALEAQTEAG